MGWLIGPDEEKLLGDVAELLQRDRDGDLVRLTRRWMGAIKEAARLDDLQPPPDTPAMAARLRISQLVGLAKDTLAVGERLAIGGPLADEGTEAHLRIIADDFRRVAVDASPTPAALQQMYLDIQGLQEQTAAVLDELRKPAGERGAADLSTYYRKQASSNAMAAGLFLGAAAASTLVFMLLAVYLFRSQQVVARDTAAVIESVAGHAVFLGAAAYLIGQLFRGYRANSHLKVVNQHRRNALDTYVLFSETATDEQRQVIVAALVAAIFTAGDSGFLDGGKDSGGLMDSASVMGLLAQIPGKK